MGFEIIIYETINTKKNLQKQKNPPIFGSLFSSTTYCKHNMCIHIYHYVTIVIAPRARALPRAHFRKSGGGGGEDKIINISCQKYPPAD